MLSLSLSCSDKNIDTPQNKPNNLFIGEWNLSQIFGGFSPTEKFENGDVVFDFTENDSVNVSVEIALEDGSKLPYKNDTTLHYNYDSLEVFIADKKFEYIIADSVLKLYDDLASDGIMIELVK